MAGPARSRARPSLRQLGSALGLALSFVLFSALGLLLHADAPPIRAALEQTVERALSGRFRGQLSLDGIDEIGAGTVVLRGLRMRDENAREVLAIEGVRVRFGLLGVLNALLGSSVDPLNLEHVRVERSRVALIEEPGVQGFSLARAFASKQPSVSKPGAKAAPKVYRIDNLEVGAIEVVTDHPELGPIQVDVARLQGKLELAGKDSRIELERFGLRVSRRGEVLLTGTASLRSLPKNFVAGTFHGFIEGTELDAGGRYDNGVLSLRADVPRAEPERLRARLPGWPLTVPVSAHFEANGPLAALAVSLGLSAESTRISARGTANLEPSPKAQLALHVEALDARLFAASAPSTRIDAEGALTLQSSPLELRATLETQPTHVAGAELPKATLELLHEQGKWSGRASAADARGKLTADVALGDDGALEVIASLDAAQLAAWPELAGRASGRASAEVRARLAAGHLSARFEGHGTQLRAPAGELERARFEGVVDAPLAELAQAPINASLSTSAGRLGPLKFAKAELQWRGPPRRAELRAELWTPESARGSARAALNLEQEPALHEVQLNWRDPNLALDARIQHLNLNFERVQIDALTLSGAVGSLKGRALIARNRVELEADAEALDVTALSQSLGVDTHGSHGRVSGHLELSASPSHARGAAKLEVRDFTVRDAALGKLRVDATLAEQKLDLALDLADSAFGRLDAKAQLNIAGDPLQLSTWRRATGQGSAALRELPLFPAGLLLAQRSRIKGLDGRVHAEVQAERRDPDAFPSVFFAADTEGLSFRATADEQTPAEREIVFDRFAVHASASLDGPSGDGAATLLVTDEHGALVTTSGSLQLELSEFATDPRPFLHKLIETPLDVLLRLHPRPLSLLPEPLSVRDLAGTLQATLQLSGTLEDPVFELAASAAQVRGQFADADRAVDVSSVISYAPLSGRLNGQAEMARAGTTIVNARLTGKFENPLTTEHAYERAELHAAAMLNGVPLELWPSFARERLEARLYGSMDLELSKGELSERAQLEIAELSARGQNLGNGRLSFDARAGRVRAELSLGSSERYLHARVVSSAPAETPGDPDAAAATPGSSFDGTVVAQNFSASGLSPLLSGIVTRLDGDVDANLTFTLQPRGPNGFYLGINGNAELDRASAHVNLLGLEVRDLSARLSARSTPRYSVLLIDPIEAKVRSASPNLRGDAELWLEGLRVTNGESNLSLNDVPLSLEGAALGSARGAVKARLERQPDHMALEVKLPELLVQLPASSARSLISLEANSDVVIARAEPEAAEPPGQSLLWRIRFELGERVRLSRADLDVQLSGQPLLEYRDEVRPSGNIAAVPGGRVTLFDQSFTIERGLVTLVPDQPNDPRLDITASWRAPDGTTVYVDITGSAKNASVSTRDDRGLQDVERFALLTGASAPAGAGGPPGAGEGALGQTFSLGINELLRESVGNLAVSIGTTPDDRSSYSASVRLSDKLSFQGNYRSSSERRAGGSSSDVTGTLDYRISRHWSLRTELGTSGGAFDLLWSHRY